MNFGNCMGCYMVISCETINLSYLEQLYPRRSAALRKFSKNENFETTIEYKVILH